MTRKNRITIVCALAALLAACGPDDPFPSFEMKVHFNTDLLGRCSSEDCASYGMGCGAILSLRIVDSETTVDDTGQRVPKKVYVKKCMRIPEADSLCALADIDLGNLPEVPADPDKTLRLEIALWSPGDLGVEDTDVVTTETCPKDIFDLQGIPLLSPKYAQPAFGGAWYFRAGYDAIVDVPLACTDPEALNAPTCLANAVLVTARVNNLESGIFVPPLQAHALTVSIAKPTEQPIDQSNSEWVILPGNSHDLALDTEALIPVWSAAVQEDFGNTACVLALDRNEVQPTTSALCTGIDPTADELPNMRGFLVSEDNRITFLGALGLAELPAPGLVIGRVVDDTGNPLRGVQVRPANGDSTIEVKYLSEDRMTTTSIITSANGYFFVENAPFGTAWEAEQIVDHRRENGTYRAGNLVGKISVIQIEMEPTP